MSESVSTGIREERELPSNRFREWIRLVPKDIRRWAYSAWREHIDGKIKKSLQKDEISSDTIDQSAIDEEFENWERTQLHGVEARKMIEKRLDVARNNFDKWLALAFGGQVQKKDVLYAALIGSSYILPRSGQDSDIDIGVVLKKGVSVSRDILATGNWGWSPQSIEIVHAPDYVGKVDFFLHNAEHGNIFFVISPHCPLYKAEEFDEQTLKELIQKEADIVRGDFDLIRRAMRGEGPSQEQVRQDILAAIEGSRETIHRKSKEI